MNLYGQGMVIQTMDDALKSKIAGLTLVVLATACWSTSGIFISWVVEGSGISPVGLAFWRDISTFTFLLIALAIFRPELLRIKRSDLPWIAAMGTISIGFFHVLWNTAVLVNGVSVATVIQCNAPIFVTVMAWVLWREPLTPLKILAIVSAGVGIVLIARLDNLAQSDITLYGLAIALLSALAYGSFSLFGKKLVGSYSSWTLLLYVFGFASLALLPFQLGRSAPWPVPTQTLFSFVALVIFTTITGFGLYTSGLRRLQASIASITSNTEVPFAAILSYLILGERLDVPQVVGAILVVGGVILVSLPRRNAVKPPVPVEV
jgi:drug/metabolite transporter (DMT)-like permease